MSAAHKGLRDQGLPLSAVSFLLQLAQLLLLLLRSALPELPPTLRAPTPALRSTLPDRGASPGGGGGGGGGSGGDGVKLTSEALAASSAGSVLLRCV